MPVRCSIFFVAVPVTLTIVLGTIGGILGTEKVDSPGSVWIGLALLFQIPGLFVCVSLFPLLPMSAGDEGSFEFLLLWLSILPSSCFYALVGWTLGHLIAASQHRPPDSLDR
jgi:hypothetical protein